MHLSELRDQAAHTLVCGLAGVATGATWGAWGVVSGFVMQGYRETGTHGWLPVLKGEKGLLDMIVGSTAGILGAFAGTMLLH